MAQGDQSIESIAIRVANLDALVPSPDDRAAIVWAALRESKLNLTTWDLVCFAQGVLGSMALEYMWLREPAKMVSVLVHKAHYIIHTPQQNATGLNDGNKDTNKIINTGPVREDSGVEQSQSHDEARLHIPLFYEGETEGAD